MTEPNGSSPEDSTCIISRYPNFIRKTSPADIVHYMMVVEGAGRGKKLEIGLTPISIGRHGDNRLSLSDPFISGHHCTVSFEEGQIWVTDLDSTNGTFIDGTRINERSIWPISASLQIGNHILRQEYRHREDMQHSADLEEELQRAATYVQTLLPQPLVGSPVTADWQFVPCAGLGGDIFDYFWLDDEHFVVYLLDVCGHGVGAALHSVSVFNLLRKRFLPNVDFTRPTQVLNALNQALPMESYAGMYLTLWYGVYQSGILTFASAGHPPALLFDLHQNRCVHLFTDHPPIGITDQVDYGETTMTLPPESRLYLYSDGVYELPTEAGEPWSWADFVGLLEQKSRNGVWQPELILQEILAFTKAKRFEDDFSLLSLNFHVDCTNRRDQLGVDSSSNPDVQ
jgi:sigma-B regulation protein RsbU (phosphoserine phosphatase)